MTSLLELLKEIDIEKHLQGRGIDPEKTKVIIDKKDGIATFLLYNLSGKLVGYQRYDPSQRKLKRNVGKYYTYIAKEAGKRKKLAVWGTETIDKRKRYLFVTEGIFDAVKIHNANEPAVAVLTNNPKPLKEWFFLLRKRIIVILDRDAAGGKLAKFGDKAVVVPEPYGDLGDMPQQEATKFIKSVI